MWYWIKVHLASLKHTTFQGTSPRAGRGEIWSARGDSNEKQARLGQSSRVPARARKRCAAIPSALPADKSRDPVPRSAPRQQAAVHARAGGTAENFPHRGGQCV